MNLPSKFGAVYEKNRILFQGMLDNSLDFKCYEISLFENRKNRVVRKVSYNIYLITFKQYRTLTGADLNETDVSIINIRHLYQYH